MSGPRSRVAFASPLWGIVEAAKLLARVAGQRVDQNLLRSAVGDPGRGRARLAGKAAGLPQHLPVRRPVACPGESVSIHERLCDQNRVPMHCVEVAREPAKAQAHHPRSEVRRGAPGQDEEPRVVGNQVKATKLLLGKPPDPAVAGLELERAGVPAHEREPVLAEHCDVAHASPDQSPEGQIVVRAHQRIPAAPLASAHRRADRDLAQPSGNQLEHRLRRGRWACAPTMAPSTPFVQRPSFDCRINQLPARKNWPLGRQRVRSLASGPEQPDASCARHHGRPRPGRGVGRVPTSRLPPKLRKCPVEPKVAEIRRQCLPRDRPFGSTIGAAHPSPS